MAHSDYGPYFDQDTEHGHGFSSREGDIRQTRGKSVPGYSKVRRFELVFCGPLQARHAVWPE